MLKIDNIKYFSTSSDSAEYAQAIHLSEQVLRIPLGRRFSANYLKKQRMANYYHFVASLSGVVVAAATARTLENQIQICQVATAEKLRRQGIGSRLLTHLESTLVSSTGLTDFFVFARATAVRFYERSSYAIADDLVRMLVGLEHRRMSKHCVLPGDKPSAALAPSTTRSGL